MLERILITTGLGFGITDLTNPIDAILNAITNALGIMLVIALLIGLGSYAIRAFFVNLGSKG